MSGRGVYKLSGGACVGSLYDVGDGGCCTVSHDLWGFLAWIREELRVRLMVNAVNPGTRAVMS